MNYDHEAITVAVVHGTKGLDKSQVSIYDNEYAGVIIWDDDFDMAAPES